MKITQIVTAENEGFYGLGEDNKLYFWDYDTGAWIPQWRQD